MGRSIGDLINFLDDIHFSNNNSEQCEVAIDEYKFYQYSLIPAVCLTILMAFTKHRSQKLLDFLNGRPGLVYPMDTLTRTSRWSYCAVFGATAFLVYEITLQKKFAIEYDGPIALKSLIAIVSMFIYGMVFFPIYTSLALKTALSYGLGSLYIWVFFIVDVYSLVDCSDDLQRRKNRLIMRALPSVICRAFLSVSLPIRFVKAIMKGNYFKNYTSSGNLEKTVDQIQDSYQGRHVRKLLRKPIFEIPPESFKNKVKAKLGSIMKKLFYHRQRGFRFPSRFVSVMFVGAAIVYILTVEFLFFALSILDLLQDNLDQIGDFLGQLVYDLNATQATVDGVESFFNALVEFADVLYYSLIVATSVSCALTLLNILHTASSYRNNVYALYRGDNTFIPLASQLNTVNLCVGSIKFAGFQVAYFIWGYIITNIVLILVCIGLGIFILLMIHGHYNWLVNKVFQIWPGILTGILLMIIQKLLARFVFLQGDAKHLRLDNRRFYFIFVYFMFFYNIFLGIASCLLRIIKAIALGILFMCRLDNSTLPRRFEFFDPGFSTYKGYIHMEVSHTHPVVLVFIQLLYTLSRERKSLQLSQSGIHKSPDDFYKIDVVSVEKKPRNRAARFNWLLTYTLLHNPGVRMYRKGFQQLLKKAMREGLKVPISDQPITEFDLVKLQEEKDKKGKSSPDQGLASVMPMMNFRNNYVDTFTMLPPTYEVKM